MKLSLASSKICAVLTNIFAVDGTGHYNVQYCQNLWQEEKKKKGGGGVLTVWIFQQDIATKVSLW